MSSIKDTGFLMSSGNSWASLPPPHGSPMANYSPAQSAYKTTNQQESSLGSHEMCDLGLTLRSLELGFPISEPRSSSVWESTYWII